MQTVTKKFIAEIAARIPANEIKEAAEAYMAYTGDNNRYTQLEEFEVACRYDIAEDAIVRSFFVALDEIKPNYTSHEFALALKAIDSLPCTFDKETVQEKISNKQQRPLRNQSNRKRGLKNEIGNNS
jgi:hypothetical protein